MSSKLKKQSSSLSFSLSRWFRRVSTTTPSALALTIAGIVYSVFLLGGGLYTLITRPAPSAYVNGVFYFLYPSISSQFISDTIIAAILYGFGFIGLFVIYQSTKSAYNPQASLHDVNHRRSISASIHTYSWKARFPSKHQAELNSAFFTTGSFLASFYMLRNL